MVNQITIDENNIITCCSIGGYIGGIDVENIPDEVMENPGKWKFIDGGFFPNEDYIEEELSEETEETSELTLEDLALAIAELAEVVMNG